MIRRILVLRGGALGDFMVTLPALQLLRERWPEAQIELAGNAVAAELGVASGLLNRVYSQHEQRWAGLYRDAPLPTEFAHWLGEFDLIVNYWPDPEGALRGRFPLRDGQLFLRADALPTMAPAAAHYCEPLRPLGLIPKTWHYSLPAKGEFRSQSGRIAIHPGSGSPRKNWPPERWLELIASLAEPVLLILGEAEIGRWSTLTSVRLEQNRGVLPHGNNALQFAVDLPLPELARQLRTCRLFLGHDSGISHLAAALDVPALLLFGPTDPKMWAPPGEHVKNLQRGPALSSISVEDVRRELSAFFGVAASVRSKLPPAQTSTVSVPKPVPRT